MSDAAATHQSVPEVTPQPEQRPHLEAPCPFPVGVRMAHDGDEAALFRVFLDAYKDNGWGGIDLDLVAEVARRACHGDTYIAAVVAGPDRLEAVIGLQPAKMWYGDAASWYWSDLLFYVHPKHRRSRHYARLFEFARWWEQKTAMPVVLGVQ